MRRWLIAWTGLVAACGGGDGALPEEGTMAGGTVALAGGIPVALAVDDTWVYWSISGPDGAVRRAPRAGGDPVVLATDLGYPQLRLVVDERNVYLVSSPGGLLKLPKDGSGPAEPLDEPATDVAALAAEVYWSTGPTIVRAPSTSGPSSTILQDLYGAEVLAVDALHVYFVDRLAGELHRAGRDGSGERVLDAMIGDSGATIALDDEHIYWGVNGQLSRVDKADGAVFALSPAYGSFGPVSTDGVDAYTFRPADGAILGEIRRLPIDGGEQRRLITGIRPNALGLDDAFVYWGDVSGDAAGATIRRAPK